MMMPIGRAVVATFGRAAICSDAQPIVVRFPFVPLAVSVNVGSPDPAGAAVTTTAVGIIVATPFHRLRACQIPFATSHVPVVI